MFGIIERPEYGFEGRGDAGYSVITTGVHSQNAKRDLYLSLKNPKNYKENIPNLLRLRDI